MNGTVLKDEIVLKVTPREAEVIYTALKRDEKQWYKHAARFDQQEGMKASAMISRENAEENFNLMTRLELFLMESERIINEEHKRKLKRWGL